MSIKFIDSSSQATNGEGWTQVEEFKTKGTSVQKGGVTHIIVAQEFKMASLLKRIGAIVLSCLTLGSALISDNMRNICFYGKEVTDFAVPSTQLETEKKKAVEATKAKIERAYNRGAFQTVKSVGTLGLVGAVTGGLVAVGYLTGLNHFAPSIAADISQYISPEGLFAASAVAGAAGAETVGVINKMGLKASKKVIAVGAAALVAAGASAVAFAEPKLAVAASLLAGAAGTTKMIFNIFNARKAQLIAQQDKKIAPAQA